MSAPLPRPAFRYSPGLVAIHWITAALVAASAVLALCAGLFDDEKFVIGLHRSLGFAVLVIALLRIVHKRREPAAPEWEDRPLLRLAAHATHFGLYALLLLVPLLGWLQTSASGKPFMFFDIFQLPPLMGRNRDVAELLQEMHEFAAFTFMALIGLHVAAALWHRVARRDGVMYAMLPLRRLAPETTRDLPEPALRTAVEARPDRGAGNDQTLPSFSAITD